MLRCFTKITIIQQPSHDFPTRTGSLIFNFCNEAEMSDSWRELTNKGSLKLPKSVYIRNQFGERKPLGGPTQNLGGFSQNPPWILRGDKISIQAGYVYFDRSGSEKTIYMAAGSDQILYSGFISKVTSKKPFVLELEDNMWKLKQIPAPNKVYSFKTWTLESILQDLLQGTGFTVNKLTTTTPGAGGARNGISLGDFRVGSNETIAVVLDRLRRTWGLDSYFRGNELRCGSLVYIEKEAQTQTFKFQLNIISDELEYQRKDDIVLSCVAYSINSVPQTTTTKDGYSKTKKRRLEAFVSFKNGKVFTQVTTGTNAEKIDLTEGEGGERHTFHFLNATDPNQLLILAQQKLSQYYYDGFKGKFTTFGVPFVRQGDNAKILDPVLPERNGLYKIRSVKYTLGMNGNRQEIELDYRISALDQNGNSVVD